MSVPQLTISDLAKQLQEQKTTAMAVTRQSIERINSTDGQLNAFVTRCDDAAFKEAAAADVQLRAGSAGPLTGIPLGLKDIFSTKGVRTTCGSKILDNYVPVYDATVVERLRKQGAVIIGKLNMDEFAMGSSNETSSAGVCRNPWDRNHVPGGSSGGSAVAVAAGQVAAALGTDTGGSIRQPAAHCGVVGLKPTYGRVSRYGVIAYASSLDQVGPITRNVEDCALLLAAIAGYDPRDSTSVDRPVPDYQASLNEGVAGKKIGLPREYFIDGLDPEVKRAVDAAMEVYRGLGAELVPVSLPHTDYSVACYYLIATAEASSNLARYDGVRFGVRHAGAGGLIDMYQQTRSAGFGDEVKRRIMLGTYALSSGYYDAYYLKAQKVRTLIRQDFTRVFAQVDLLLTPVAPTAAFKIGEKTDDPLQMYLSDIFTIPANLAGTCAMSIPCGFDAAGLPIGLQLIGKPFGEGEMLQAARAFEQATDWHTRQPSL
ncbi:Asp-tRNA(Asn)/Glu-tRNA(Gln) amidotransferase subunit GatA [Pelovirga terrestris]|uniref:Glutamyl-tRNA(Gln) amidotransferase subunit A n=1 Tax=Pelovirga terrestris TaxID=2771352 RepID=A0A8J6QM57_9BACT|nr:Asp-tRNA(Asn)/Glu-tRNA(Gln) amidotransferase subunit GatA [Pelovirga terrestris]MBD1401119.1 Asp-tRNA(Asn)/Glu-tRNA(Gln) amidotransferase subunit GatA [Pelovirga terrestris]